MVTTRRRRGSPTGRRRRTRPVGATEWTNVRLSEATVAIGGVSEFDVLGGFTETEKARVAVILRAYGEVTINSVSANNTVHGAFGLTVVNDEAMAASVLPDPLGDENDPWYWHREFNQRYSDIRTEKYPFDARTQRRVPIGSTLMFALDLSGAADGSILYSVNIRVLFRWR